jgi:hypothetical protein
MAALSNCQGPLYVPRKDPAVMLATLQVLCTLV